MPPVSERRRLSILARAQAAASMTHRLAPERTIKQLSKKHPLTGSGQASAAAVEEERNAAPLQNAVVVATVEAERDAALVSEVF